MSNLDGNNSSSLHHSYTTLIHTKLLDIITEITTGKTLENAIGSSDAFKTNEDFQTVLTILGDPTKAYPWKFVPGLWNIHPLKKKLDKHTRKFEDVFMKIVNEHVPNPDSASALDFMINTNMSKAEIWSELITLIIGGHESVSGAFGFLLWMLAIEQTHQAACHLEVDEFFEKLKRSKLPMSIASLSEMKYVERCIKETLRLFPSFFMGTTREPKSPLALAEDMEVPAGTLLSYSPYILHRDPKIYPDPEAFDPDRFLPENVRQRHAYAYLPFSAGPRNCIAWKAALLELKVLSAVVLRHLHIRTTDTRNDIPIKLQISIVPSREPNLIFEKRNKCVNKCCSIENRCNGNNNS